MKDKALEWLLNAIIIGAGIWLLYVAIVPILDTIERADCHKWQQQAQDFPLFEATSWQLEQCETHNINIYQFID